MSEVLNKADNCSAEFSQFVEFYANQIDQHPIASACREKRVSKKTLQAFARCQYTDSETWVAMLALAKGNVKSKKLREAIRNNIRDEVGDEGIPHITLCKRFVESVGVPAFCTDIKEYSPASVYPVGVMLGLSGNCSDGLIGGWLLSQEILVPIVFRLFRPAFEVFENADLRYLLEHEEVDSVFHSRWIEDALQEIAINDAAERDVFAGIHMGGRATVAVLDYLFAQSLH